MKVRIYTVILPLLAVAAFAQGPPEQPNQNKPDHSTAAPAPAKTSEKAPSDRLPEMKTQKYSGTLMDASCAGSGASESCKLSTSTTEFAMKMKDGTTVRFDDVGNTRVHEVMKTRKKWSESASGNKAIQVKANGVLNGDKLTVLSID